MSDFEGKHVVITGGSSGIGKSPACLLARGGARVTIVGRDPGRLASAKGEIRAVAACEKRQVVALPADVRSASEVNAAVKRAIDEVGPPDSSPDQVGAMAIAGACCRLISRSNRDGGGRLSHTEGSWMAERPRSIRLTLGTLSSFLDAHLHPNLVAVRRPCRST